MDWLGLLRNAIKQEGSQAAVARKIGYSSSTINQVLHRKYAGSTSLISAKVIEVYGNETVFCPVLGEIPLGRCSREKQMEFSTSNPLRVELSDACQNCGRNL